MSKQRAVVIFPGRGSYGTAELGYLAKRHADRAEMLSNIDDVIVSRQGTSVAELDGAAKFSPSIHLPGRNASNLIYSCAQADFAAIDRDKFDIVAICGNSLGWYLSLAASGAVSLADGALIVDTMGDLMERKGEGGQVLYPLLDRNWVESPEQAAAIETAMALANQSGRAYISIKLGGIAVLAGDEAGLAAMMKELPPLGEMFPLKLPRHAAFHTPVMADISSEALQTLPTNLFQQPSIPLVDGRGVVWRPHSSNLDDMHAYTFGHQIVEPYDFTRSVEVAVKEFAPDTLLLAGPGASLLTPVGQTLTRLLWKGMADKRQFDAAQAEHPFVIALGETI